MYLLILYLLLYISFDTRHVSDLILGVVSKLILGVGLSLVVGYWLRVRKARQPCYGPAGLHCSLVTPLEQRHQFNAEADKAVNLGQNQEDSAQDVEVSMCVDCQRMHMLVPFQLVAWKRNRSYFSFQINNYCRIRINSILASCFYGATVQ